MFYNEYVGKNRTQNRELKIESPYHLLDGGIFLHESL